MQASEIELYEILKTKVGGEGSKIIVTIAIINPVVTKALEVTEIISGIIAAMLFLGIAMLLEKGD